MGEAAYSIKQEPDQSVEIVVHITETLAEEKRADLVSALENNDGIISAEFCPLRYHLMLVRYDRSARGAITVARRSIEKTVEIDQVGMGTAEGLGALMTRIGALPGLAFG